MRIACFLPLAGVAACVPPPPRLAVPPAVLTDSWGAEAPEASAPLPDADFWGRFGAAELPATVARAREANPTLDAARARVAQARGLARIAGAALLPSVGANAGVTATRTDNQNVALFSYSVGQAGLDVGYDLDLFGGARAGRRAARARAAAAAFDRDAIGLVVETDAARALVQWATLGDRIAVVDRDVGSARELRRILEVRLREGVATRVELGLQAGEVARLEAGRSALAEARSRIAASLAALVGAEAPGFVPPPVTLSRLSVPATDPGQPGDLLFRRPDVRAAEARIAAARGDVQQARAAFLPSLRLTGSGLVQAAAIGGPFGATLAAGAGLLAPIFQGGRLRGQYEVATAAQVEAVALYREVLLRALAEGDQALAGVRESARRADSYASARADAATASRLARIQYLEGEISIDTLIETERNETQTADAALVAQQDRLLAAIDLYKALGGAAVIETSAPVVLTPKPRPRRARR